MNTTSHMLLSSVLLSFAASLAPAEAALVTPAGSDPLTAAEILNQFNGIVSGNFSTTSDVEGRLVAGTINNPASATFNADPNPSSGASAFQAVNALTIPSCPSCSVNNGGSINFINSNAGTFNFNGTPSGSLVQNSPAFTTSDFTAPLNALETSLGKLTANSTATLSNGNITFDLTPVNGVAVFNVPLSDLAAATNSILFSNFSPSDTVIINVTGATGRSFTQSVNFNAPSLAFNDRAIWNFDGATSLSLGFWHGSVLAGAAAVTNTSPIEGALYAASFAGDGELHDFPFTGAVPSPIPEPSTWAMSLLGFALLGYVARRKGKVGRLSQRFSF